MKSTERTRSWHIAQRRDATRRLLDSGLYKHHKAALAGGVSRYFQSVLAQSRKKLMGLQRRTEIYLPLVIMICGLGAYYLWYRLMSALDAYTGRLSGRRPQSAASP